MQLTFCGDFVFCDSTEIVYSNNFCMCMRSLVFPTCKIISLVQRDHFTFSFLMWMPFISISGLTALVRIPKTILNRNGESEPSCLVPDLRGKSFNLSPLSMMSTVGFSYIDFTMLRCYVSSQFGACFYHKKCVKSCKMLSMQQLR